mgnify:CR=1 FL=1|jgi:DNA-binding MltR family transcriptional regulator
MTKQETAKQIISQVLEFMQDNDYIDSFYNGTPDILSEDIEQLQDIAYGSIEEFMSYVAKGTLREQAAQ